MKDEDLARMGQGPRRRSVRLPLLGGAAGAFIAAVGGWLVVPNTIFPQDGLEAHLRLALAAVLAATPWAIACASLAYRRPVTGGLLLFAGTFLSGYLTVQICGVQLDPQRTLGVFSALNEPTVSDAIVPRIALGALLWSASLLMIGWLADRRARSLPIGLIDPGRRGSWVKLTSALVVVGLLIQGCSMLVPHHEYPASLFHPTIVGVVKSDGTLSGSGWHVNLTDGQTRDLPQGSYGGPTGHGGPLKKGNLFLEGTTGTGGWWAALPALGGGCWEAYSQDPAVWDLGSSILFTDGLELPKAPGFWAEVAPRLVDRRLAWLQEGGDGGWASSPTDYCANDRGQIEFARLRWVGESQSPSPAG